MRGHTWLTQLPEVVPGDVAARHLDAAPLEVPRDRLPIEIFAAVVAFLIPIASPGGLVGAESWSGRAAILLVVTAVGLPILVSQAREPKAVAARAALAFVVVGSISAVLSANHTTAVFGLYNQGTGLLFMAGLAAAWAIGRSVRPQARSLVEGALILGVLVNVGIALLASAIDLSSLSATLVDSSGRSNALVGNPVHLGALAVLGLALMVPRFASAQPVWAIPVAATACAAQLSGSRLALLVMIVILAWAGRRHGIRVGAALAVCVVVGLAAGSAIGSSGSNGATARVAGAHAADSVSVRPQTWLSARHAVAQHPFLGVGPGQFRTATSPFRTESIGRNEGPERLLTDAHNLFVEYATTTGLLGAGALAVWLLAAGRRAQGCLLAGALGLFAIHMFEPQSIVTTPLAFLALGASWPYQRSRPSSGGRRARLIIPTFCIVGAVSLAAVFLLGEFDLRQAQLDLTLTPASQANSLLPAWPATATIVGRVWLLNAIVKRNQDDYLQARSWRLIAVQRDDSDPGLWNDLAEFDESQGHNDEASAEFSAAVHFNPTSVRAMGGLARLARQRCDSGEEQYWTQRALRLSVPDPASRVLPHRPPSNCGTKLLQNG